MGALGASKASASRSSPVLSVLVSTLPLICAIALYQFYVPSSKPDIPALIPVRTSFERLLHHQVLEKASTHTPASLKRVSVGYNSNLDLIVADATELFKALELKPTDHHNHASIASKLQLEESLSYFFSRGSAAERFVEDGELFNKIISVRPTFCATAYVGQASKSLEKKHYFIGGNSALMAQRFAEKGCEVHLGGAIGSTLASLLHKSIWTTSNKDVVDEVHLILEYKKAPRANRYIIVRDLTNGALTPLEEFHQNVKKFSPQLIIIAGLHLLEGQAPAKRTARLRDVVSVLRASPPVPLHFELASVGSNSYLSSLLNTMLPEFDSMGLNEQELGFAYVALGGQNFNTSDFVQPSPQTAADALLHLFSSTAGSSRLARIHFHSLSFHIIAQREKTKLWSSEKAHTAVAAASLATTRQACDSERINAENVDVLMPPSFLVTTDSGTQRFKTASGVVHWHHKGILFHLAPVLVCRAPTKTVGLGDIISATGLMYSY